MSSRQNTSIIVPPTSMLPQPHMTLRDQLARLLVDDLVGVTEQLSPEEEYIEQCREKCRQGNPFPLIAAQWPQLIVTDEREIKIFRSNLAEEKILSLKLTDSINRAVLDPKNPVLRLDFWQHIILAAFFDVSVPEIFIKGCTGAGKGASTGIGFALWYYVHDEARVTLTSRSFDHAITNIFGEVKQWYSKMKFPGPGSILGQSIAHTERHYVKVLNPSPSGQTSGEAFSGAHGKNTIYGFDEATASPDLFFDNAEKNATKIIALANPRTLFGRFRSAFKGLSDENKTGIVFGNLGQRLCVTVGAKDCLNANQQRIKKPVAPRGGIEIGGNWYDQGQPIPPEDYQFVKPLIPNQIDTSQERMIRSHRDPRHVAIFADGQFPVEDPDKQVILSSWLERHQKAWHDRLPVDCFGLDVARSVDGDHTTLSAGGVEGCRAIHRWQYADTVYHANRTLQIAKEEYGIDLRLGRNPVCVDMDGLGAGVGDILRSWGVWVIEFRGNATSIVDPRTYANLRAEAYATLGRRLSPNDRWKDETWALPTDAELAEELCAPEKLYGADPLRFHITPKQGPPGEEDAIESIKKKLGRSPDKGDSVVYLYHGVREFHLLNQLYLSYAGDLIVSPGPRSEKKTVEEIEAEKEAIEKETSPQAKELLRYLAGRAGGAVGDGDDDEEEVVRFDYDKFFHS